MTAEPIPGWLDALTGRISRLDEAAMAAARERQAHLTKPPGSLGRLEAIAVHLAGIQSTVQPRAARSAVIVAAGDHGITEEGVSAYPSAVTAQMVANFLAGGAAINAIAGVAGARLVVADFGVAADLDPHPALVAAKVARGTANFARGPAMTRDQAAAAVQAGARIVATEHERGLDLLALGEMGIGNTTAAAALTAALTGTPPAAVTGRGTGLDDAALAHKVKVVEAALARHRLTRDDPFAALVAVGGFEIAGLVGAILEAAARRVAVVLDGFITGAAALVAVGMAPATRGFLVASHRSVEPGHGILLDALGLDPLFDLQLRLGEGSGAALALPLIAAAVAAHNQMATFAEAGVSGRGEG